MGDWVNHVNPSMVEKIKNHIEEKLSGSSLSLKMSCSTKTNKAWGLLIKSYLIC